MNANTDGADNTPDILRITDAIILKRTVEIKRAKRVDRADRSYQPKLLAYLGAREQRAIKEVTEGGVFLLAEIVKVDAAEHLNVEVVKSAKR